VSRVVESVTFFYNQSCPTCRQARDTLARLMAERGVPFAAKEVTANVDNRDLLILTTGQVGAPAVLVDKREVVGLDQSRLEYLLGVDVGPDHPAHW
jgi:glutaredoxin